MKTIPSLFLKKANLYKDKPLFWYKVNNKWVSVSWKKSKELVLNISNGLSNLGVNKNDKVSIISENSYKWCIADLAINTIGSVTVPGYTTSNEEELYHLISHSETSVIFTNSNLFSKISKFVSQIKRIKLIILFDNPNKKLMSNKSLKIITFDDLNNISLKSKKKVNLKTYINTINENDLACLIYTSGTSSLPKGVMLTHKSVVSNILGAAELIKDLNENNHRFLSILPLSHAYEHTAGFLLPLLIGGEIYFNENRDHLINDLQTSKPTLMIAVPRLYDVLYKKITSQILLQGKLSKYLFFKTIELGSKEFEKVKFTFFQQIFNNILSILVRQKIKNKFGGNLETFISGGAALNYKIGLFFNALGIKILQGYGQTECSPIISTNPISKIKLKTVGPAIRGLEIKLSDDNEILVKGTSLMNGYWKDKKSTNKTIINGWLHTGDIGHMDCDDYITITGRKNEMIVNSGGENISPVPIENRLLDSYEIEQVLVFGHNKPFLIAIIVLNDEVIIKYNANKTKLKQIIKEIISNTNLELSQKNKIRKFFIAKHSFNIKNMQLTPTLKIKRNKIIKFYQCEIENLYKQSTIN